MREAEELDDDHVLPLLFGVLIIYKVCISFSFL